MTEMPPMPPTPAPTRPLQPAQPPRDLLTPGMLEALIKTKPWVRFLSIVGFVGTGLMGVLALGVLGVGVFQATKETQAGLVLIGMGLLYLALAVLYVFPSLYLARYAKSIGQAVDARSKAHAVEQALRHQKSFWKFAGILTLVGILVYIPGILAAIAIPNLLTAMQRARQKRTMADMRSISVALEAYGTDANAYPDTASMGDLAKLLEPKYIAKLPRVDGWGNPFVYDGFECNPGCTSYTLASGAADAKLAQSSNAAVATQDPVGTDDFDDDIVVGNGVFVRYPGGPGK